MTRKQQRLAKIRRAMQSLKTQAELQRRRAVKFPSPPCAVERTVIIRRPFKTGVDTMLHLHEVAELLEKFMCADKHDAVKFLRVIEVRSVFPAAIVINGDFYWYADEVQKIGRLFAAWLSRPEDSDQQAREDRFVRSPETERIKKTKTGKKKVDNNEPAC